MTDDLMNQVARACAETGSHADRAQKVADLICHGTGHR
jgi:hypothetical protein